MSSSQVRSRKGEIKRLLERSRMFVLACARADDGAMDNLPTVIMEAMAAGLPVISTDVAAVSEMVVDGETGFIVPEKDSAALARRMACLVDDPELARTMGMKGALRGAARCSAWIRHLLHFVKFSPSMEHLRRAERISFTHSSAEAPPDLLPAGWQGIGSPPLEIDVGLSQGTISRGDGTAIPDLEFSRAGAAARACGEGQEKNCAAWP